MALNKDKVIAAAQRFTQKGQLDRAIKEYRSIVEEDPEDIRVWLKIGDLYTRKGSVSHAVQTYCRVADHYRERGFFQKAVAVYRSILKIDPGYIDGYLALGDLHFKLAQIPDAIVQFQIVVGAYERQGRHRESLDLLRRIVELAPEDVPNRIRLAEGHASQGEAGQAIEQFNRVLTQLEDRRRYDEFVQVGERLLYLAPDNVDVVRRLAEIYVRVNEPKRALARLQAAFRADPRDPQTLDLLARTFVALDQVPKAVSVFRELAHVHLEGGRQGAAGKVWRRLLELDPGDPEALEATGSAAELAEPVGPAGAGTFEHLSESDQIRRYLDDVDLLLKYELADHAVARVGKALALNPQHRPSLRKQADLWVRLRRFPEAVTSLLALARIEEANDPAAARHTLEELLAHAPDHDEARARLARLAHQPAATLRGSASPGTGSAAAPLILAPPVESPFRQTGAFEFNLDQLDIEGDLGFDDDLGSEALELAPGAGDVVEISVASQAIDGPLGALLGEAGDSGESFGDDPEFGGLLSGPPAPLPHAGAARPSGGHVAVPMRGGPRGASAPEASVRPAPASLAPDSFDFAGGGFDEAFGDGDLGDAFADLPSMEEVPDDDAFGDLLSDPAPLSPPVPAPLSPPVPAPLSPPVPAPVVPRGPVPRGRVAIVPPAPEPQDLPPVADLLAVPDFGFDSFGAGPFEAEGSHGGAPAPTTGFGEAAQPDRDARAGAIGGDAFGDDAFGGDAFGDDAFGGDAFGDDAFAGGDEVDFSGLPPAPPVAAQGGGWNDADARAAERAADAVVDDAFAALLADEPAYPDDEFAAPSDQPPPAAGGGDRNEPAPVVNAATRLALAEAPPPPDALAMFDALAGAAAPLPPLPFAPPTRPQAVSTAPPPATPAPRDGGLGDLDANVAGLLRLDDLGTFDGFDGLPPVAAAGPVRDEAVTPPVAPAAPLARSAPVSEAIGAFPPFAAEDDAEMVDIFEMGGGFQAEAEMTALPSLVSDSPEFEELEELEELDLLDDADLEMLDESGAPDDAGPEVEVIPAPGTPIPAGPDAADVGEGDELAAVLTGAPLAFRSSGFSMPPPVPAPASLPPLRMELAAGESLDLGDDAQVQGLSGSELNAEVQHGMADWPAEPDGSAPPVAVAVDAEPAVDDDFEVGAFDLDASSLDGSASPVDRTVALGVGDLDLASLMASPAPRSVEPTPAGSGAFERSADEPEADPFAGAFEDALVVDARAGQAVQPAPASGPGEPVADATMFFGDFDPAAIFAAHPNSAAPALNVSPPGSNAAVSGPAPGQASEVLDLAANALDEIVIDESVAEAPAFDDALELDAALEFDEAFELGEVGEPVAAPALHRRAPTGAPAPDAPAPDAPAPDAPAAPLVELAVVAATAAVGGPALARSGADVNPEGAEAVVEQERVPQARVPQGRSPVVAPVTVRPRVPIAPPAPPPLSAMLERLARGPTPPAALPRGPAFFDIAPALTPTPTPAKSPTTPAPLPAAPAGRGVVSAPVPRAVQTVRPPAPPRPPLPPRPPGAGPQPLSATQGPQVPQGRSPSADQALPAGRGAVAAEVPQAGPAPRGTGSPERASQPAATSLQEIDFLLENKLLDDAEELLLETERSHAGHADVVARRSRLTRLRADEVAADEALGGLFSEVIDTGSIHGAQLSDLGADDASTHFDLGVAFKEMQQYRKAIEQLEIAARAPAMRPEALRVLGLCHLEQGDAARAVERLEEALGIPGLADGPRSGIEYDLASVYERQGDRAAARARLVAIVARDPSFHDAKARLARLGH